MVEQIEIEETNFDSFNSPNTATAKAYNLTIFCQTWYNFKLYLSTDLNFLIF